MFKLSTAVILRFTQGRIIKVPEVKLSKKFSIDTCMQNYTEQNNFRIFAKMSLII